MEGGPTPSGHPALGRDSQGQLRALSRTEFMVHRLLEAKCGPRENNVELDVEVGEVSPDHRVSGDSSKIPVAAFTDCKSLYDHLTTRSAASAGRTMTPRSPT